MKKQIIFTLLLCFSAFFNYANAQMLAKDGETYSEKRLTQLSKKLGIELSQKDSKHIKLYETAAEWLGTRYTWGGNSKASGVDCSGFTCAIYDTLFERPAERSSSTLSKNVDIKLKTPDNLQPGDMVFFATSKKHSNINHVGVYLKDGYFVHASSAKGKVIISTLLEGFYKKAWKMGGRFL